MTDLTLEIVEGPAVGRHIPLEGPLEIGREPGVGLELADELLSRRHARVTPEGTGAVVEDLGSLNGTFVNGNEVHGPARVEAGDQLQIGVTVLELRTARQIAVQPSVVREKPPALAAPARLPDYIPGELLAPTPRSHQLDPLLDIHT